MAETNHGRAATIVIDATIVSSDSGPRHGHPSGEVAAILLAGGSSSRMGRPKATLPLGSTTFVAAGLRALGRAGFAPILLVSGEHTPETLEAIPEEVPVTRLRNPTPEDGQLSSLKLALAKVVELSTPSAALMSLVDHPAVRDDTLRRLRDAASPGTIVVPRFKGQRGHPVVFGCELFPELLATPNDQGARAVVRRDPDRVVEIETGDRGVVLDIDTPGDLQALREHQQRSQPLRS